MPVQRRRVSAAAHRPAQAARAKKPRLRKAPKSTRQAAASKFPRQQPNVNAPPPPAADDTTLHGKSREAFGIDAKASQKMDQLLDTARQFRSGNKPQGVCYRFVKHYLSNSNQGAMVDELKAKGMEGEARQFAQYFNKHPDRLAAHGYRQLPAGTNPFDAPKGAIVVVAPRSPGTRHPTAGDIAISTGQGTFVNDGVMKYGGDKAFFTRHPEKVLGVYVPANEV